MSDLEERLERARRAIDWNPPESSLDRLEQSMVKRRASRQRRQRIWRWSGVAAAFLVVGSTLIAWQLQTPTIQLADGSRATLIGKQATLTTKLVSPALVELSLDYGGAKFSVARNPERLFRVRAGAIVVEVIGTQFSVMREGALTHVVVDEGRVRVLSPDGERILGAKEQGWWTVADSRSSLTDKPAAVEPPAAPAEPKPSEAVPAPADMGPAHHSARPHVRPVATSGWRETARSGDFDQAYVQLSRERAPATSADDLLLAADVHRLSHHPREALEPLTKLLRDHPDNPRAPLAAFTLGRVYLDDLGQPRPAAESFAKARVLDPLSPLVPDSLAREAEAWWKAGEPNRARVAAQAFVALQPDGPRAAAVKRYGGLP